MWELGIISCMRDEESKGSQVYAYSDPIQRIWSTSTHSTDIGDTQAAYFLILRPGIRLEEL